MMPQRIPEDGSSKCGYAVWANRLYNVYESTLELKVLKLLKRLGKCIVMIYQGDDPRQTGIAALS